MIVTWYKNKDGQVIGHHKGYQNQGKVDFIMIISWSKSKKELAAIRYQAINQERDKLCAEAGSIVWLSVYLLLVFKTLTSSLSPLSQPFIRLKIPNFFI